MALGTNRGAILLFSKDGSFLLLRRRIHVRQASVISLCIVELHQTQLQESAVVSCGEDGRLVWWNFITDDIITCGQRRKERIVDFVVTPYYEPYQGTAYLGLNTGSVIERTFESGFRPSFEDNVVFYDAATATAVFTKVWEGEEIEEEDTEQGYPIHNMMLDGELLVFSWKHSTLVLDTNEDVLIMRLYHGGDVCQLAQSSKWSVVRWSTHLSFVPRDWDARPFKVLRTLKAFPSMSGFAVVDKYLLMVMDKKEEDGPPAHVALYSTEAGSKLLDSFPLPPSEHPMPLVGVRGLEDSQFWIVYPRSVAFVRPLAKAARALWLVESKQFDRAMKLCQGSEYRKQLLEIANLAAGFLWESGQRREAMALWAERVLPHASSEFWRRFAHNVAKAEELALLEHFLPFDRPTILEPEFFAHVLLRYLDHQDYRGFSHRVGRWPVCYPPSMLIERIAREIMVLEGRARGAGRALTSASRMKVGVEPSTSMSPRPLAFAHRQLHSVDNRSKVRYLFRALFCLFDYQDRHVMALRVLLAMQSSTACDYFIAHSLWTYLVEDPLRVDEMDHSAQQVVSRLLQAGLPEPEKGEEEGNSGFFERRRVLEALCTGSTADTARVIGALATNRMEVPLSSMEQLLSVDRLLIPRLQYFESCTQLNPERTARLHDTMIDLYCRVLGGRSSTSGQSTVVLGDTMRHRLLVLVRTSQFIDFERAAQQLDEAGLKEAAQAALSRIGE